MSNTTKEVHIPKRLSPELAEFVGIIMGDGYLYNGKNKFTIGIVGHPINDYGYFEYVQKLIFRLFNKETKIKKVGRGLRIIFDSKEIFIFLAKNFISCYGKDKCEKIEIPEVILKDWKLARHTIRGLTDTDGSIFFCNKPGSPHYPSIEITTSSKILAEQLREILIKRRFRVANIWSYKSKLGKRTTYKVPLNGVNNLKLWMNDIGFSNPHKRDKASTGLK